MTRRALARRSLVALAAGSALLAAGCSRAREATAAKRPAPVGPAGFVGPAFPENPVGPRAADTMFASSDDPFRQPLSSVNVFGELDGGAAGPSAFALGSRAGFQQHTYLDEGYDADGAVSPDGKTLLFSSTRHSERTDLYTQSVDGLAITQLTTDPADDAFAAYSSDGSKICFSSNRSGNWDVYVMDADGKNARPVTRTPAQEVHPSFSPDGGRLVYASLGSRSGQWELWVVDLATDQHKMIGYGLFPAWSPVGETIAFQRARQRGTRWFSLWTLELVAGEAKNLTEIAFSANAALVSPSWSPDGKRLAFSTIVEPTAANAGEARQDVWTINLDGSARVRLTDGKGTNASPAWGAGGRVFFVSDRGGSECVWSATVEGKNFSTAAIPTEVP